MEEEVPEWILALINAEFVKTKGNDPSDLKYVCIDCATESLTEFQMKTEHKDHHVLESFKSSGCYGYCIDDIYGLKPRGLDSSGIAIFKINTKYFFWPKSRKLYNCYVKNYGVSKCCFTCGWRLDRPGSFCSILCKLLCDFRDDPNRLAVLESCALKEVQVQPFEGPKEKKKEEKKKNEERSNLLLKIKVKKEETKISKGKKKKLNHRVVGLKIMEQNQVFVEKPVSSLKRMFMKYETKMKMKKNDEKMRKQRKEDQEKKKSACTDKKLQILISAVVVDNNGNDLLSFRKISRKGIPCRSPLC